MSNLHDVKVSDALAVRMGGYGGALMRKTVARVTATQVVDSDGKRYAKTTGVEVGCGSFRRPPRASPWGPQHDDEVQREATRELRYGVLKLIERDTLSLDQLRRIEAICNEPKPEEPK